MIISALNISNVFSQISPGQTKAVSFPNGIIYSKIFGTNTEIITGLPSYLNILKPVGHKPLQYISPCWFGSSWLRVFRRLTYNYIQPIENIKWNPHVWRFSDIIYPKSMSVCPYYKLSFLVSTVYQRPHVPLTATVKCLVWFRMSYYSCWSTVFPWPWLPQCYSFSHYTAVFLHNKNQDSLTNTPCIISTLNFVTLHPHCDNFPKFYCITCNIDNNCSAC